MNLRLLTTILATRRPAPARTVSKTMRLLTLLQSTLLTLLIQSFILKEKKDYFMTGHTMSNPMREERDTNFSLPSATLPLAIDETYIPVSFEYWGSSLPPTRSKPKSSSDARPLC